MIKFASELILKPVLLKKEKALAGIVEDLVINPDNGELVGILVREGFGKNNLKTLAEKDILQITNEFYLISGYESLGDVDEIVRVKAILDRNIRITGNKVVTVSGTALGRVRDYTLNTKTSRLNKIYVDRGLFRPMSSELIISFSQIISIESDKITVADTFVKESETVKGQLAQNPVVPG